MAAMLTVLNKRWISQGWRAMEPQDAEPMALVWIEVMDNSGIPWQQYGALYLKAMAVRMQAQRDGAEMPHFSAELMAGCWPELREELRQRDIEQGRTLTAHAPSTCPLCFGTGKEYKFENGQPVGVTGKPCEHNGPADSVYMLDGKPATYDDFEAVLKRNERAIEQQKRDALPTAEQIVHDASCAVWAEADAFTSDERRLELSDIYQKLRRIGRYVRTAEMEDVPCPDCVAVEVV